MTWSRLSDDFADDCWKLSDAAFRLHTEAICWSGRKLLDCRIPRDDFRRFSRNGELAVSELLACGWWRQEGDVYVIVHHSGYQRTAEEVLRRQESSAANGRRGGRPSKATREQVDGAGNLVGSDLANPTGKGRHGKEEGAVALPLDHQNQQKISAAAAEHDPYDEQAEYERRLAKVS